MPEKGPQCEEYLQATALKGEIFSFQIAYKTDMSGLPFIIENLSDLQEYTQIRRVELEPVEHIPPDVDSDVVGVTPGLYPDILEELPRGNMIPTVSGQWRSLWITVRLPEDIDAAKYDFKFRFSTTEDNNQKVHSFTTKAMRLQVINAVLPKQTIKVTHWFHADCIAEYYQVPVFSEAHWEQIDAFLQSASAHGMNTLLTPLFTPPLDTEKGMERPTVQLVQVKKTGNSYTFDFTLLTRWIALARKNNIRYFELSHLFTQWGATHTPKIVVELDGKKEKLFGWHVPANSREYQGFLTAFLSELKKYLEENELKEFVYFHCSDEPSESHLESYAFAAKFLKEHLEGYKILDALSSIEFYNHGLVGIPVTSECHLEDFLDADVPERWVYYCCGPIVEYPNRFIYMNSSRNRALGLLLYKFKIQGFLHWGFNFYYSQYSRFLIDPYRTANSYYSFPAGDPFLVYPGRNEKPVDSIRHEVFYEALQDQRALELLETKMLRSEIEALLDQYSANSISLEFKTYTRGEEKMLQAREAINQLLIQFFG